MHLARWRLALPVSTAVASLARQSLTGNAHPRFLSKTAGVHVNEYNMPVISKEEYTARRRSVLAQMPTHSLAIFPSAPQQFMSEDVPHLYHQNTDLSYLSGCDEPGSVLVLDNTVGEPPNSKHNIGRSILFVEPRSAEREQWDGPMLGVSEETRATFGVDAVAPTAALPKILAESLARRSPEGDAVCQRVFLDPKVNESTTHLAGSLPSATARDKFLSVWSRDTRPKDFVCRTRLIKSEAEAEMLRLACSAISGGLNDAMAQCSLAPDAAGEISIPERSIEALIEFGSKMRGATRMAFPSVVASGRNGTILHYMVNSSRAREGDFVMVDAGCIIGGVCSDVSRSWPVNGKFSGAQRDIYSLVLDVQLRCIDMARAGVARRNRQVSLNVIHAYASRALTEGLMSLGFMEGLSVDEALATGAYQVRVIPLASIPLKARLFCCCEPRSTFCLLTSTSILSHLQQWFGHSIGHYLGSDVHDTHSLSKDIPLLAGMCVTIEPGLYIRADDETAPAAFRGIGMRIEDDLLVTPEGAAPEVLSHEAAKAVEDIEALVGSGDSVAPGGLFARPDPAVRIATAV
jgi:Xaa-Pro aminopeptidase